MALLRAFLFSTVWLWLSCNDVFALSMVPFDSSLHGKVGMNDEIAGMETIPMWGVYTPYHTVGRYFAPPRHCKVTQVNILQRHGARFPVTSQTVHIKEAIKKFKKVSTFTDPRFEFLKNFTYDLGADHLVALGAKQSEDAGRLHFQRYADLVSREQTPFIRATLSERVVDSGNNWTIGFAHANGHRIRPSLDVIMPENGNDTLDNSMCPNSPDADPQVHEWLRTAFPSITDRINAAAPGANLTHTNTYHFMMLCPYYSVAKQTKSQFCDLFTHEDWEKFEYAMDLDTYYDTGYGNPLGAVQGVGYINELLARLTGEPVKDNTQTNRTLDSSPETFPLNRTFYIDFSHDPSMHAIFAAMGLFSGRKALDPKKLDRERIWVARNMIPFSARMIVEKVHCEKGHYAMKGGKDYVRIFVNDATVKVPSCSEDMFGMCELGRFIESQAYARNDGNGDFEKCYT